MLTVYKLGLNVSGFEADSLALVDFYNSVGGPNWTSQGEWLTGPVSTWVGVTVTDGRVTGLEITSNNMSGTIPASVGKLTELTKFRLIGDENPVKVVDIHGSIPAELWNCTKLKVIQLKFTNLTGNIPAGIEKLVNLEEINLQQSYLGCELPEALFNLPKLVKAYLHQSNFKGTVPASLANATKLTRLYLQGNKLTGALPYVELPATNKAKVELTGNFFTFASLKPYYDAKANYAGFINDYQYAKETTVALADKGVAYKMDGTAADAEAYAWFKGDETVPVGTEATQDVTLNTFSDEATYTCKAQSSMAPGCNLLTVYKLGLNITGIERDSLALVDFYNATGGPSWTSQGEWLTGPVSTWAGVVVANGRVTELATESNNMSGTIPPSIGQLTELVSLKLNGTESPVTAVDLNGSIPAEIWNLTKLTKLQIKYTNITGDLPAGIEKLVNLQEINFQQTYLGCEIPEQLFNLPALTKAYLHESNFTGSVPASLVNATKLTRLYLQRNKLSGELPFVNIPAENKAKVELTGNYFSFAAVKPYHDAKANYAGFIDDYQWAQDKQDITSELGKAVNFTVSVADGEAYNWFKDNIVAPVGSDSVYAIAAVSKNDQGVYTCKVQNSTVPNFDIRAIYTLNGGTAIPVASSAETSTDGKTITLTFDYEMGAATAEIANFAVVVNNAAVTVSSAVTNGATIVLTLSSAIPNKTATVTVAYIPGTLTGSTGGAVAAFGPINVTNKVTTGINDLSTTVRTYPNPVADVLTIQSSDQINHIGILDVTGRVVLEVANISTSMQSISVSNLQKGIYFVSVKTNKGMISKQISKK
jgi:hypothetical protein